MRQMWNVGIMSAPHSPIDVYGCKAILGARIKKVIPGLGLLGVSAGTIRIGCEPFGALEANMPPP